MAFLEDFLRVSNWETLGFLIMILASWMIIFIVSRKNKKSWSMKVISALMLGLLVAVIIGGMGNFDGRAGSDSPNHWTEQVYFYTGLFNNVFYKSIQFIIPFMLFSSLTHTMSIIRRNEGPKVVGKSVGMLFAMYFSGLMVALLIVLGFTQIDLSQVLQVGNKNPRDIIPIAQTFVNFIPRTIGDFFSSGVGVISSVIAGAVFGFILNKLIKKNPDHKLYLTIERGVLGFYKIMTGVIRLIIAYLPYAIVSFLTRAFIRYGTDAFTTSGIFIGLMYVLMFIQITFLTSVTSLITKQNPLKILRKSYPPVTSAFFTQSSASTIPLTRQTAMDNFKVNETTASIVPTFGATGLMVACSGSYPLLAASLVGSITPGVTLDFAFYIQLIIVISVISFGIAGVPGTATIGTTNVFNAMSLDFALLGVIFSVDAIIDMGRTATNVYGALTGCIWAQRAIDRSSKKEKHKSEKGSFPFSLSKFINKN